MGGISSGQAAPAPVAGRRLNVRGSVQGVGFRPFAYRLACALGLAGRVVNSAQGVVIDIEGEERMLDVFVERLKTEAPPLASVADVLCVRRAPTGASTFEIGPSVAGGGPDAELTPDAAMCSDCREEISDPRQRRYRYPFTNCTNCGPRYSIMLAAPYDRANTTMARFAMCAACRAEYVDPRDRRFHAQPIACPDCGPQLILRSRSGDVLARKEDALMSAAGRIRAGAIVAVNWLGGVHLVCYSRNGRVLARLRARKQRPRKPFAVMVRGPEQLADICTPTTAELKLFAASQAPIVLVRKRICQSLCDAVAPANPYLGVMRAYTPLHYLLLDELGTPLVATSGNRRSEPISTNDEEALRRLDGVADCFLTHDRPIARAVDDSVVRRAAGATMTLRRARGYAPAGFPMDDEPPSMLAVGGHLKNTVAQTVQQRVILSPHIGDLDTIEAREAFGATARDIAGLNDKPLAVVVCDQHQEYYSSRFAESFGVRRIRVQHHRAHIFAVMAEHGLRPPLLGVAWDGAGAGEDGTLWGGECFAVDRTSVVRAAHWLAFPLPGGEAAMRDPRHSALGLGAVLRDDAPNIAKRMADRLDLDVRSTALCQKMIAQGINAPRATSVGRIFDGVSAMLGLCRENTYEGEAATMLEFAAEGSGATARYPLRMMPSATDSAPRVLDWRPMLTALLEDYECGRRVHSIARKFHNTMAEGVVLLAKAHGLKAVALSGGCFQNRILLETTVSRLRQSGFTPYWPQKAPPNDGGLALGQIYGAVRALNTKDASCA